ncbi:hypothetical protein GCM10010350_74810 [Streptomyces galilaeus]|nr:hypothetical protein GCM10010350_74810 [Streptomyces galilaeus]
MARPPRRRSCNANRLWLNARHLGGFRDSLSLAVRTQESEMRAALVELVGDGVRAGEFTTEDPLKAVLHILVAVEGLDAYASQRRRTAGRPPHR